MGLFWDFMRYGLPVGGALGTAFWANKRGMTSISTAGIGVLGWGLGYGVYRLASGAANAIEGLPSQTYVPQIGSAGYDARLPQAPRPETMAPNQPNQPNQQGELWDKAPGADYQSETRGRNGQPPHHATVIDIGTRQPVQGRGSRPQMRPYDPGDSFGGGGTQGGN
jgi:hypothetical protein